MRWAAAILDSSELQARLSHQELSFVQAFFVSGGKLLKGVLLDQLPAGFRSLVGGPAPWWEVNGSRVMLLRTLQVLQVLQALGC
jgi:hypothetical protein